MFVEINYYFIKYIKLKVKHVKVKHLCYPSRWCVLVFMNVCARHRVWLWCIYCSELLRNNSSILAHVSGERQQHSAFPALCVPARLGLGLGFHSHLELRAQECHCSSFQTMAGSDTHANTHKQTHACTHTGHIACKKKSSYIVFLSNLGHPAL